MNDRILSEKLDYLLTCYSRLLMGLRYGGPGISPRHNDKQWKINNGEGRYGYIPSHGPIFNAECISLVYKLIKDSEPKRRLSFIDAGCGCGNILALACVSGFGTVHGIEIDPETAELARKFMGLMFYDDKKHAIEIINSNIVTFSNYGEYDCIYVYQPIYGYRSEMLEFLKNLSDTMKINACVIFHCTSENFHKDERFERVNDSIYRKVRKEVNTYASQL